MSFYEDDSSSDNEELVDAVDEQEERRRRERRKEKRKEKKRRIKQDEMAIEAVLNSVNNVLTRYRETDDPVLRHSMFIDKFMLLIEIVSGMSEAYSKCYNPQIRERLQSTITDVQKDLKDLSNWIRTPTYGPDHGFGHNDMRNAEADFNCKKL